LPLTRKQPLTNRLDIGVICAVNTSNTTHNSPLIFISACEASGDKHAAPLITQIRKQIPKAHITGVGGANMANAGCDLLKNTVEKSAMGFAIFGKLGLFLALLKYIKGQLAETKPDIVVVIDSFAFNSHIAKHARKLGIPVLYYIAPQLWAWAPWRIGKLKKSASRVASIFPFEAKWYAERNFKADYVGNPLFDHDADCPPETVVSPINAHGGSPLISLLPGSRQQEIDRLWVPMQSIALNILGKYPNARFYSTAVDTKMAEQLRQNCNPTLGVEITTESIESITTSCDLCLVASGTATLQVATTLCPMIVMYYISPLVWHTLGKLLLRTDHISLVNILAQKEIVPEVIPFHKQQAVVTQKALEILGDKKLQAKIKADIKEAITPLNQPGAASNTTGIIIEMLGL